MINQSKAVDKQKNLLQKWQERTSAEELLRGTISQASRKFWKEGLLIQMYGDGDRQMKRLKIEAFADKTKPETEGGKLSGAAIAMSLQTYASIRSWRFFLKKRQYIYHEQRSIRGEERRKRVAWKETSSHVTVGVMWGRRKVQSRSLGLRIQHLWKTRRGRA